MLLSHSREAISLLLTLSLLLGFGPAAQAQDNAGEWEFPADWFFHGNDQAKRAKHTPLLGKPMPRLSLADWRNGQLTPADMKGKILVLDFWATWCGPCIASIPKNNDLYAKYKDQGVELIGICTANGQEKYQQVLKEHNVQYPSARDRSLSMQKAFRVMWYPTYAVVDRQGKIRAIGLKPNRVEDVIEKLLEESPGEGPTATDSATDSEEQAELAAGDPPQDATIEEKWLEGTPEQRARFASLQGAAPPPLTVTNWVNSPPLKLDSLKGKVVLLDFWATWCGPCIASIPHTNELMEKYHDQGLVIIGVCHQQGAERMRAMVKEKGIKYPVAADNTGKTNKAYLVNGYPDYYFIDRSGKLRIADCKNGSVEAAIKALLAEPGPTASR